MQTLVYYQIDCRDCIVEVCAEWDALACASGGGLRAQVACVLGQSLFDFISGDATRMFMRAAIVSTRLHQKTRVLPYRCDHAQERRWFDMSISPMPDQQVRVSHKLVQRENRVSRLHQLALLGEMASGWCCSQCLWVRPLGGDRWLPPEESSLSLLAADLCPSCERRP